jgi:hypothetical protein
MRPAIGILLLSLLVITGACSKKESEGSPASAAGILVDLQGITVKVNGEPAGDTRAIEDLGRVKKIDDLFERLKKERDAFEAANPTTPFPGRATISAHPQVSVLVFKSMFETATSAGYPNLRVAIAGDAKRGPSDVVAVSASVSDPTREPWAFGPGIHLYMSEKQVQLSEKRGNWVAYDDTFASPTSNAELRDRVSRSVVDLFSRRHTRANAVVDLIVHLHNHLWHEQLSALLRGAADAHERLAGPGDEHGAFRLQLAIH